MQVCDKRDERPALLLRCGLAVDSGFLSSKQLLAMATKREVARAFLALRLLPCVHLKPFPHRAVFTPHDIPLVRYTAWCQRKPTHTRIDHPCQNAESPPTFMSVLASPDTIIEYDTVPWLSAPHRLELHRIKSKHTIDWPTDDIIDFGPKDPRTGTFKRGPNPCWPTRPYFATPKRPHVSTIDLSVSPWHAPDGADVDTSRAASDRGGW